MAVPPRMDGQLPPPAPCLAYVRVIDDDGPEEAGTSDCSCCCSSRAESHQHASCSGQDVTDNGQRPGAKRCISGERYTSSLLRSTLLLMGCKPRVAHKVSRSDRHLQQVLKTCSSVHMLTKRQSSGSALVHKILYITKADLVDVGRSARASLKD